MRTPAESLRRARQILENICIEETAFGELWGMRLEGELRQMSRRLLTWAQRLEELSPSKEENRCCGCTCHVCREGHGTGDQPHSQECKDRFWAAVKEGEDG